MFNKTYVTTRLLNTETLKIKTEVYINVNYLVKFEIEFTQSKLLNLFIIVVSTYCNKLLSKSQSPNINFYLIY